jgi:Amino acid transporters
LGELATHNPTSGAFFTYGTKYVEGGFGFALGWNYWYNWAITVAFELVAVQFIMKFWFPDIPGFYWSAIFLAVIFGINALTVKGFGESEFFFSLVKVLAIIAFIIIGIWMIAKIMLTPGVSAFANWSVGEAPFVGGFQALIGVAMIAGFSFQGTEMVGVAPVNLKIHKKPFQSRSSRSSGESCCSISYVFSLSVHWLLIMIRVSYRQLQQKMLPFLHSLYCMRKRLCFCSQHDECGNSDCDSVCR